jgi:hypothetical protein
VPRWAVGQSLPHKAGVFQPLRLPINQNDRLARQRREVGPMLFLSLLIITVSFCRSSAWKARKAGCFHRSPIPCYRSSCCSISTSSALPDIHRLWHRGHPGRARRPSARVGRTAGTRVPPGIRGTNRNECKNGVGARSVPTPANDTESRDPSAANDEMVCTSAHARFRPGLPAPPTGRTLRRSACRKRSPLRAASSPRHARAWRSARRGRSRCAAPKR